MKKRILILGAGNAQIDLIQACHKRGLETYGCSYADTDPGISLLDHFEKINIVDVDAVTDYAQRWRVDFIYSVGSDIAMPTVSRVAERLGLPHFVSSQTADICCQKQLLRQAMGGSEFNLPYAVCAAPQDAAQHVIYPAMMKPVDSQGQRGVILVNNEQELTDHFAASVAYSKRKLVIVERFVDGDEVSVNAYVKDGQVVFHTISDRLSFQELPGGIIRAHTVPSHYEGSPTAEKVYELVRKAVQLLGIYNGPAYFQIKIEKGHPYLIEATPRLDGCHMWTLIERFCGVNLLEMTLTHLLGEQLKTCKPVRESTPWHLEFFCQPPGTVFNAATYDKTIAAKRVYYYRTGDTVRRLNGHMEKCGYRLYSSPKKVGVIGGSGTIGSRFLELYDDSLELINISRTNGAVSDYTREQLERALEGCDSVVLLAGKKVLAGDLTEDYEDNVRVTKATLDACRTCGIANIVFASTRCVYDQKQPSPISEDGIVLPINAYGVSKYAAEQLCKQYNASGGAVKILRLAQVLGKADDGYMLDTFTKNALAGNPLLVYGRALGRKDYIYVDDVCRAIWLALHHSDASGVYNIGSGYGASVEELARAMVKGFGSPSPVVVCPDKPEDTAVAYLDVTKAQEKFGFVCEYTLEEAFTALKKLIN